MLRAVQEHPTASKKQSRFNKLAEDPFYACHWASAARQKPCLAMTVGKEILNKGAVNTCHASMMNGKSKG